MSEKSREAIQSVVSFLQVSGEQFEVVLGALFTVLGFNVHVVSGHDSSPQQAAADSWGGTFLLDKCGK